MQSNATAHRVLYDGVYTLVMRLLNVAAAAALGILTARLLGPAGKGFYALPMVQAGLVSSCFAGLSSATTYVLLNERAGRYVTGVASAVAGVFVVIAAAAVLLIAFLGHALWAAPAAIASLPCTAALNVVTGYVVGVKRVRYATALALAGTLASFAIMAFALLVVARSPSAAIAAWIAANAAVSVVALAAMILHARKLPGGTPVSAVRYARLAAKVGAVSLVSLLNYRADLYVVALLASPAALGLYTVAVSAAESLLVPTQVAALVTAPHIGEVECDRSARLAARCVRNNLIVALLVCAILFAVAPYVVRLLYGAAFLALVPALRILLVGVLALSLGSPVSSYFTLKLAQPEVPFVLAAVSASLCILTSIWLVPRYGISGAAVASTLAYLVGQGLGLAYFSRAAGISPRTLLLPTAADFALYRDFLRRAYDDAVRGLALLRSAGERS